MSSFARPESPNASTDRVARRVNVGARLELERMARRREVDRRLRLRDPDHDRRLEALEATVYELARRLRDFETRSAA